MLGHDFNSWGIEICRGSIPPSWRFFYSAIHIQRHGFRGERCGVGRHGDGAAAHFTLLRHNKSAHGHEPKLSNLILVACLWLFGCSCGCMCNACGAFAKASAPKKAWRFEMRSHFHRRLGCHGGSFFCFLCRIHSYW